MPASRRRAPALNRAELELGWTRVLAPEGGLVTDLQLEVGTLAQPGQPLMTFVGINDVWIQADLRENNLGHVRSDDPVDIALDVRPGRIFKGRVRSIGFGVDAGTSTALGTLPVIDNDRNWLREAQRFPVIIEIDDVGDEVLGLRVGAQATVMVYTEESSVLRPIGKPVHAPDPACSRTCIKSWTPLRKRGCPGTTSLQSARCAWPPALRWASRLPTRSRGPARSLRRSSRRSCCVRLRRRRR